MKYTRHIQPLIEANLYKGKIIIIYGARRVGKTTLCEMILNKPQYQKQAGYINCELLQNKTVLETTNSELLKEFIGNKKLLVLDEAHKIKDIGLILKILVDTFPDIQIIATGSSSFELTNELSEPLTGRTRTYLLLPLSYGEIKDNQDFATVNAKLDNILRFGTYPSVYDQGEEEAKEELNDIASKYLYKDILELEGLKRTDLLLNLLRALAFQVGSEVSYTELATLLKEHPITVQKYVELLEKCFVIFRLRPNSRNLRKEIANKNKIYFYDLGIRNTIIQSYNPLGLRNDIGALWENFCVVERLKYNQNRRLFVNSYFWRSYSQKEIDYLEEKDNKLTTFEFKWQDSKKQTIPEEFRKAYPDSSFQIITRHNYWQFLTP